MITRNLTNSFIKMRTTHFSKFNSNDTDKLKRPLVTLMLKKYLLFIKA